MVSYSDQIKWTFRDLGRDPDYAVMRLESPWLTAGDMQRAGIGSSENDGPPQEIGSGVVPAWEARMAKHREYVAMCRAFEWEPTAEEQLEIFSLLREVGL